ncbi:phage scaffolding protein [Anaerosporobacter sp.]
MKRKFLEDLGLEKEVIDKIMAENGSDIEAEKTKAKEQVDNLQGQLDTVNESLKKFDGVDVETLKGEISTLQTTLQAKETEFQKQLAERDFNQQLEAAINTMGAKNAKAVKALLDIDTLKGSKNQEADIKAAIEACQKDNDYLFGTNEPINNPTGPTGGGTLPTGDEKMMSSMMSVMGIKE